MVTVLVPKPENKSSGIFDPHSFFDSLCDDVCGESPIDNATPSEQETPVEKQKISDPVDHPLHYNDGGIETIDFIEAKKLGFNLGNVVKYVSRAGKKGNALEDLRKAKWYLEREIANVEKSL